ncbi:hypothetical protein B0H67DRAFT_467050, partial [Lasiosphaeris hirsuta]
MTSDTGLPARYEIRTLAGPEHAKWACAIITHCSFFASPVFSKIYTQGRNQLCYAMFQTALYQMSHQVESGLSLGIFDTEYQLKRPESAETDGKLYWDPTDLNKNTSGQDLLEQMDFPLVSVALAYDNFFPLDKTKLQPLFEAFPLLPLRNRAAERRELRNSADWQATGPGQVLLRGGTATKVGEEGRGFMKKLSWYMMRKAAAEGFRGIQIGCLHDAVSAVWQRPPAPFTSEVVVRFTCAEDDDEELRACFQGSDQEFTRIYVTL